MKTNFSTNVNLDQSENSMDTRFLRNTGGTIKPEIDNRDVFQILSSNEKQIFAVDTTNGWVNIGPDVPLFNFDPAIGLYSIRNLDSYSGINVCNYSTGTSASTDIVAIGSSSTSIINGFMDMGINGVNNEDPSYAVFDKGCGYLWTSDGNLYIGTQALAEPDGAGYGDLHFFTGGTDSKDNIRMSILKDGKMGFFGHAAAAKPTVTGSKGGNEALASLITALSNLGLITDSTT
jgi:hypothetical protein